MTVANVGATDDTPSNFIVSNDRDHYVADGPLARAYCDALSEIYKKEVDPQTGLALETQAIDAIHSQSEEITRIASKIHLDNEERNMALLYGVVKGETTVSDLISVTDAFSVMTPAQKHKSAVVIDAALLNEGSGSPAVVGSKTLNPFEKALEQLCLEHNVSTYSSFAQFVKLTH